MRANVFAPEIFELQ